MRRLLSKALLSVVIFMLPVLGVSGLVTGASKIKFVPGDKVLFATDFKQCPIGEVPEGFDKIDGVGECVRYNDRIWYAPSSDVKTRLSKKLDLGAGDFSIEFTALRNHGERKLVLELYKESPKGWDRERLHRSVTYSTKFCEIEMEKMGVLKRERGCDERALHFALQVRRCQLRLYLNGKRLAATAWSMKKGEKVSGFSLYFDGFDGKPYGVLVTDVKAAKYTRKEAKPTPEKLGIDVTKTREGMKLTVPERVLFDFNKFILKPEAKETLSVVGDFIREHPAKRIIVTGYTDNIGSDAYNLKLSLQRAQSVADDLIYCEKIDPGLFKIVGRGKADPIAPNTTDEGRAKNRRVEIRLIR